MEDPFFLAIEEEFYDIVNRYNALSNDPHSYNELLEERMEAELNDLFTFCIMDIPYEDGSHVYVLNSEYREGNAAPAILEYLRCIRDNLVEYALNRGWNEIDLGRNSLPPA